MSASSNGSGKGSTELPGIHTPPPERVHDSLDRFAGLLAALEPADVAWDDPREPCLGWPEAFTRCATHDVYEHVGGCLLCNDA